MEQNLNNRQKNISLFLISILLIFLIKIFFKIFKLDFLLLMAIILFIKCIENYLSSTSFGQRLKTLDEKIFNFLVFQFYLYLCLLLETLFFPSKKTGLSMIDLCKSVFLRTIWLTLVWKGSFLLSMGSIETFFDLFALLSFFSTLFYVNIRVKLLNHQFLGIDTSYVSWSEIVVQLQLLRNYSIVDKVNDDVHFSLISFVRPNSSFQNNGTLPSTLSSQKRTVFASYARRFSSFFDSEKSRNVASALFTSGFFGSSYYEYVNARQRKLTEHDNWSTEYSSVHKETQIYKENLQNLEKRFLSFEDSPTPSPASRLLHWVLGDNKVEELMKLRSEYDLTHSLFVRSYIREQAIKYGLEHNRESRVFPFFRDSISERCNYVLKVVNEDVFVELAKHDQGEFLKFTRIVTMRLVKQGQTSEEVAADPNLKSFFEFNDSNLVPKYLSSMLRCCYEKLFYAEFFNFFIF